MRPRQRAVRRVKPVATAVAAGLLRTDRRDPQDSLDTPAARDNPVAQETPARRDPLARPDNPAAMVSQAAPDNLASPETPAVPVSARNTAVSTEACSSPTARAVLPPHKCENDDINSRGARKRDDFCHDYDYHHLPFTLPSTLLTSSVSFTFFISFLLLPSDNNNFVCYHCRTTKIVPPSSFPFTYH